MKPVLAEHCDVTAGCNRCLLASRDINGAPGQADQRIWFQRLSAGILPECLVATICERHAPPTHSLLGSPLDYPARLIARSSVHTNRTPELVKNKNSP